MQILLAENDLLAGGVTGLQHAIASEVAVRGEGEEEEEEEEEEEDVIAGLDGYEGAVVTLTQEEGEEVEEGEEEEEERITDELHQEGGDQVSYLLAYIISLLCPKLT